ncbi:MAG: endonuclease/exonuclease/phosphatase family protein [Blastocatellia bacterium]
MQGDSSMRMLLIRFSVLAVFLVFLSAANSFGQQQKAVVAGWNIFGEEKIPQPRIEKIAEAIRKINPDLIVLSEVNDNEVPSKIVTELGNEYSAIILPQKAEVVQYIALVFKNTVTVTGAKLLSGTDLPDEKRSRKALAANVRIGNFDFVVIGIHLKSSRECVDREKRSRQAVAIREFISRAVSGNEKDVLVIGDYNMIPRKGNIANDEVNFLALSPDNFLRFVSTDFLLGQLSHYRKCSPKAGNLLDGYAISRDFTTEYIEGSTRLLPFSFFGKTCTTYTRDISDHLPIVSEFNIATDDD